MTDGKDLIERHSPAELRAIIEAKDKEIQRLHEDHKIQVDHVVEANKEIERLTAGYQSLANSHDTYMDENERLRAAIANAGAALCHQAYDRVAEILSEAPQENDDG